MYNFASFASFKQRRQYKAISMLLDKCATSAIFITKSVGRYFAQFKCLLSSFLMVCILGCYKLHSILSSEAFKN